MRKKPRPAVRVFPGIFDFRFSTAGTDLVSHRKRNVIFSVDNARRKRDERLGNDFFNEDDATADLAAEIPMNIKSQVHFFKFGVKRNADSSPKLCLAKSKANQTDISLPIKGTKRNSIGHVRRKQFGINGIVEQRQIEPLGGEEYAAGVGYLRSHQH